MRICYVLQTAGGGANQVVVDLARYAVAGGHEVTVIYSGDYVDDDFIVALNSISALRIAKSPMVRSVGLRDLRDGMLLRKAIQRAGPFDIIHAHSSKAGALVRMFGWRLAGRIIYTPHCFYSMSPNASKLFALIERALSQLGASIIVVSQSEHRHAESIHIPGKKLSLIPNGIAPAFPLTRAQARQHLKIASTDVIIGFVGRLDPQKNPIRAVETFKAIENEHRDARMFMLGGGSMRELVERSVSSFGLGSRIKVLGHGDARRIIPAFDCLLCSSDFEALPIAFLEALAAGVPIISTPVGGTEETIEPNVTGYVASQCSDEALVAELKRFLALSPEIRGAMSSSCIERSLLFTKDLMGQRHEVLYKSLVSSGDLT